MPKYGTTSKNRLKQAHPDLQRIANELIKVMDVSVLCVVRNEADQNHAFNTGKSQLKYPQSKHNSTPSMAVDFAPYPIDWNNIDRFEHMCDLIQAIANTADIKIKLGRDWSFKDYPHVELVDTDILPDGPSSDDINDKLSDVE